jgi:hypothetical protein
MSGRSKAWVGSITDFLDTYTKLAFAKLYDRKTPLVAADLLNDSVIPFFDEHRIPLQRILTDRGSEYCGAPERHEYELYLAVENIDHNRTKVKSPQTKDYASHCTSLIPCDTMPFAGRRLDNLTPCALRGGLVLGGSYKESSLSL